LFHCHGLPEFVSSSPLEGGFDANFSVPYTLIHNLPCRTPCRFFIHKLFFRLLGFHLLVWSELGRSPSFLPIRVLTLQWSWAFNLLCEVTLIIFYHIWGPRMNRNSLRKHQLRALLHMISHYTWGPMTTLPWVGLWTFGLGSHNFKVIALGLSVKYWPWVPT